MCLITVILWYQISVRGVYTNCSFLVYLVGQSCPSSSIYQKISPSFKYATFSTFLLVLTWDEKAGWCWCFFLPGILLWPFKWSCTILQCFKFQRFICLSYRRWPPSTTISFANRCRACSRSFEIGSSEYQ